MYLYNNYFIDSNNKYFINSCLFILIIKKKLKQHTKY